MVSRTFALKETYLRVAMPMHISSRTLTVLRVLLAALSALFVVEFLVVALLRLHLPYEYDWVEDGMLATVRHLAAGSPLYSAPTVDYTPYLYTPLFYYAALAMSHLTGVGYAALRWVSVLSTLGCFAVLYAMIMQELPQAARASRHLAACAGVGLFAALYPAVGASFDLGRVDMLYLLLVLSAFYATRRLNPALAAVLWVCAFQTKQGVLPIAVLALCYDWQRPRRILLGLGAFGLGMAASIAWLTHVSNGWYRYYVFGMAGGFGIVSNRVTHLVPTDLLSVVGIACLLIAAAVLFVPAAWVEVRAVDVPLPTAAMCFYMLGSLGMLGFTAYVRVHRGANVNALIPAYAWIALLFGIALGRMLMRLETRQPPTANAAIAIILLTATVQLAQHLYSPRELLAQPQETAERAAFEAQLRAIPGDVLVLSHPEYGLLAGKLLHAGSESIGAVIDAHHQAPGDALIAQYAMLVRSGALAAIALDRPAAEYAAIDRVWMPRDLAALYPLRVAAHGGEDTRFTSQPRWIYLPCSQRAIALRLEPDVDTRACASAAQ